MTDSDLILEELTDSSIILEGLTDSGVMLEGLDNICVQVCDKIFIAGLVVRFNKLRTHELEY